MAIFLVGVSRGKSAVPPTCLTAGPVNPRWDSSRAYVPALLYASVCLDLPSHSSWTFSPVCTRLHLLVICSSLCRFYYMQMVLAYSFRVTLPLTYRKYIFPFCFFFFFLRSATMGSTRILLPPTWPQVHFTLVIPVLILFTFDNFCAFHVIYYSIICYNIVIFCLLVLEKIHFTEVLLLLTIVIHLLRLYNPHDINQCIQLRYPHRRLPGTLEPTSMCELHDLLWVTNPLSAPASPSIKKMVGSLCTSLRLLILCIYNIIHNS